MRHILPVLALVVAGCGGAPGVPTTEAALGGDFYPFQSPGDGFPHPGLELRPTFELGQNGCWTVDLGFDGAWLVAFPEGSEWGGDLVTLPSGLVVTDGLVTEARGGLVYGTDGLSEPWAALADFCGLDRLAVLDSVEEAFDPGSATPADLAEVLRSSELTRAWACGYGFTQSDEAGRVELVVLRDDGLPPTIEEVVLPADGWTARVVVGAHLMVQHCDDAIEGWEPERIVGAEWPIVAGILTFTGPADAGPVTAVLRGALVETADGVVELPDLDLRNDCWGCFAG